MINIDFFIKNIDKNLTLTLPITPEKYKVEYKNEFETVRLTNFGDINIPTHHTPITFSLEGLFSVNESHYLKSQSLPINTIKCSMDYVNLIKSWIDNKDIVRVVIAKDLDVKIDLQFYIESISYMEDGETVGDILYSLIFREYRQRIISTVKNRALRTSNKNIKSSYTVKEGDYLIKIARIVYGDSKRWRDIYNANKAIIGKNPNFIYPNQVLTIP